MNFTNSYVPKRKKVNYKIVVPFLLLLGIVVFLAIELLTPKSNPVINENLVFCNLSPNKAQDVILADEVGETRLFQDFGLYGETLGLYENDYTVASKDPLLGKTLYIKNLCNDDEYSFLMGSELDSKIPIEQLGNGIYSVEVLNGLTRQRFVSDRAINEGFTALSKNGQTKHLQFIADKDAFLLNDEDSQGTLDDHYLFFNVTTTAMEEDHYDVVLDPHGLTFFDNGNTDYGAKRKDILEADATYNLALGVAKQLEEKGLKVKIIRDNSSPIAQYGPGSRTELAYVTNAKYYFQFNLQFSFYKPDKGMTIVYSNYASNGLATALMESLNAASDLPVSNFTSKNNTKGVYKSKLNQGMDGRHIVRELGGMFTGAGLLDEYAQLNENYKDNIRGMQVVSIDYGFINDDVTYDSWMNQNQAIIDATAQGILKGLRIE